MISTITLRLKDLELKLEELGVNPDPEVSLEQYQTPPELAARILQTAKLNNDLDRTVVDLGCGVGVLGIAAALLGSNVVAMDIDLAPLRVALRNAEKMNVSERTLFLQGDISFNPLCLERSTVLMNPPFGAQNKGADRAFLDAAADIASVVYTVHNGGSKDFIESYINGEITHAFKAFIDIPHTYEFHEKNSKSIPVEVYRIEF